MKKLTLLFILTLSLSFLYAKEITVSVGAGEQIGTPHTQYDMTITYAVATLFQH